MTTLEIHFSYEGDDGRVLVSCVPDHDPGALGLPEHAKGFPVCTAMVGSDAQGYRAVLGWIQLVRSRDNRSKGLEFEIDPFEPFGDVPVPFASFGLRPTLFDAPSRLERAPLEWTAHSFLAATPGYRYVRPVTGFGWGFRIDDRENITLDEPVPLEAAQWGAHRRVLDRTYPGWTFEHVEGFR